MRYYFTAIEMTTNGENRTQPYAYNSKDEAMAKYHATMSKDISGDSIIGCICLVWDSNGNILVDDKWGTMSQPSAEISVEE